MMSSQIVIDLTISLIIKDKNYDKNKYLKRMLFGRRRLYIHTFNPLKIIYVHLMAYKIIDLTTITWAHAVNSRKLLNNALAGNYDMIEADTVIGNYGNSEFRIPIMAHPPHEYSDISLHEFLIEIKNHNEVKKHSQKGVKIDFKSIEALIESVQILDEMIPLLKCSVWLNADIIEGPSTLSNTIPVNHQHFLKITSHYTKAILSIGWTTSYNTDSTINIYTEKHINNMLENSDVIKTGQKITFPVRACIAINSKNELKTLIKTMSKTNESSLTVWHDPNDFVDIAKLKDFILHFGIDHVYLDIPKNIKIKLKLHQ